MDNELREKLNGIEPSNKPAKAEKIRQHSFDNMIEQFAFNRKALQKNFLRCNIDESKWSRYADTDEQEIAISHLDATLKKLGKKIVGGTTIGKSPQTVILDLTYQGGEIHINSDGEVEIHDKSIDPSNEDDVIGAIDMAGGGVDESKKVNEVVPNPDERKNTDPTPVTGEPEVDEPKTAEPEAETVTTTRTDTAEGETKEYLGFTDDNHYYLIEDGGKYKVVNQDGQDFYVTPEGETVSDKIDFIKKALLAVNPEHISFDIFTKYIMPDTEDETAEDAVDVDKDVDVDLESDRGIEHEEITMDDADKSTKESKAVNENIVDKYVVMGHYKDVTCSVTVSANNYTGKIKEDKVFDNGKKLVTEYEYEDETSYTAELDDIIAEYMDAADGGTIESKAVKAGHRNESLVTILSEDADNVLVEMKGRKYTFTQTYASIFKNAEGKFDNKGLVNFSRSILKNS